MKSLEIITEEVRFKKFKDFTEERKNSAIRYLLEFLDILRDKYMEKISISIIKTNFISEASILFIEKRKSCISLQELAHPIEYLEKYFDTMLELEASIIFSLYKNEEKNSLIKYYRSYGYLTDKQISFANSLFEKAVPPDVKQALASCPVIEDGVFNSIKSSLSKENLIYILGFVTEKLSKLGKEKILTEIKRINSGITFSEKLALIESEISSFLGKQEAKKKEIKEIKEKKEESKIPKKFLSLDKMREVLGVASTK